MDFAFTIQVIQHVNAVRDLTIRISIEVLQPERESNVRAAERSIRID